MIHRADAQTNSYPFDCRTSAEDSSENVYRFLFVSTRLTWVAGCRALEMICYDMIWYDMIQASSSTVQPHSQSILAKESMNISQQGSMVGAEVSNDHATVWQLEQQKRCGCYSCEWTFDSFRFCILRRRKRTQVFAKLCPWVIDLGVILASLFSRTLSHTRYHATSIFDANVCKILLLALLSDFDWLITLRVKVFKRSRMKNVGKTRFLHTSGSFKTNNLVSGRSWNTMFCSWDVRIQNDSQYQLRHHRVWISLDFPDKSQVMCRCGYKHDDMIVWTDLHQAETSFQGTIPSVIAVMSHVGVATKTWMALEESLKESDGSDTAMSFECMICHVRSIPIHLVEKTSAEINCY